MNQINKVISDVLAVITKTVVVMWNGLWPHLSVVNAKGNAAIMECHDLGVGRCTKTLLSLHPQITSHVKGKEGIDEV